MDKFRARRQGNPWRQYDPSSLSAHPNTSGNKTTFDFSPGFESSADLVAKNSKISIAGSAPSTTRRPLPEVNALSRRASKASESEADKLFKLKLVEKCAQQVMSAMLKDVMYESNACRDISPKVASAILEKIKDFSLQQYKLVCVVSLGSLKEKPDVQFGSRCLWNKDTDSFVSVRYSNGAVYAVAMIFGLYFD